LKCGRREFQAYVVSEGWTYQRTRGSHSSWRKPGFPRPVIIDEGHDDLPEKEITSNLKTMGKTRDDLRKFLGQPSKKKTKEEEEEEEAGGKPEK
jgi:predicted RNA binding protein YcfA (HicA-like mRNA interferase family)